MRRTVCFIIVTALLILFFPLCPVSHAEGGARAEILIEADTMQVLSSSQSDLKLPMASVTKVMSLLLWAEDIESGKLALEDTVKATSAVQDADGSIIWLEPGEEMTAAELLEAVIIASANDACIALAEHTDGSEAQFVRRMNLRAKELGMNDTHYTNCVGYDDNGHYSTARDIAVVAAELMKHEVYHGWMLTWMDYLRDGATQLVNTNKMVRYYDGIIGGKTGTTDNAGCCLTVCAERGDMRLIAVVLGCEDDDARFDSAEALLDYGFGSFEKFTPETDSSRLAPIPVTHGTSNSVLPIVQQNGSECIIKKGSASAVEYEYSFVEQAEAPVKKGQFLGEYLVLSDGVSVFRSDIVAADDIERISFWYCFLNVLYGLVNM
ncbi:MAG: D-alanyl-D-alanine carboxypeptidase [Oscillospiraceae bacterium]|nr:D-alanyl-D-alanine carboxypeptidase [Oscillospiraceae bacterium]